MKIKVIITLTFIIVVFFLGYKITSKINYKNKVAQNIKTIPVFSYLNIQGETFTNQNLNKKNPVIFIYFNTECDFCNEEAQMIKDNITKLSNLQLIFVSFEDPEVIKKFVSKYQLKSYDNIYFLHDNKVSFATTFDVTSLPCLILYDKNQNLIEKIKGQIKVETLIKKMNTE